MTALCSQPETTALPPGDTRLPNAIFSPCVAFMVKTTSSGPGALKSSAASRRHFQAVSAARRAGGCPPLPGLASVPTARAAASATPRGFCREGRGRSRGKSRRHLRIAPAGPRRGTASRAVSRRGRARPARARSRLSSTVRQWPQAVRAQALRRAGDGRGYTRALKRVIRPLRIGQRAAHNKTALHI